MPSQHRLKTTKELGPPEGKRNSMSNKQSPKQTHLAHGFFNSNSKTKNRNESRGEDPKAAQARNKDHTSLNASMQTRKNPRVGRRDYSAENRSANIDGAGKDQGNGDLHGNMDGRGPQIVVQNKQLSHHPYRVIKQNQVNFSRKQQLQNQANHTQQTKDASLT